MSQFERSQQTIQGRMVVITSWFDDTRRTWRASAPAYVPLNIPGGDNGAHGSRKEAIDRLSQVLGKRLSVTEAKLGEERSQGGGGGRDRGRRSYGR